MLPPPEMSMTQASMKQTAAVMMPHIVPFALHDCLNSALLNMVCILLFGK